MRAPLVVSLLLGAALVACADGPEPTPCPGVVDDYAVWSALLRDATSSVVVNQTLSTKYIEFGFFAEQGLV